MRYIFEYEYNRKLTFKLDKDPSKIFNKNFLKKNLKTLPRTNFKISNLLLKNTTMANVLSGSINSLYTNKVFIEIEDEDLALYLSFNPKEILNPSKKDFVFNRVLVIDSTLENSISELSQETQNILSFLSSSEKEIEAECKAYASITNVMFSKINYFGRQTIYSESYTYKLKSFNDFISSSFSYRVNDSIYSEIIIKSMDEAYSHLKNKVDPLVDKRREHFKKLSENTEKLLTLIKGK